MTLSEFKSIPLSEDIGFFVFKHDDRHFHCAVGLIVPESSKAFVFVLFKWLYHVSFKEKMFQWELEAKELEAEEEAFFEEVERLRRGEEWRKAALER